MKQYALIVWQPDGEPPAPEALARIGEDLAQFHRELHEAGAWVFAGGLHDAATATVVRPEGDDTLLTDGPYTEGKEHVGGLCIIRAADLDAALEWGRKAARATTLPIEVRPFQGEDGG
ncbi:MAG TPA: YciI family protein [Acidimicrobiales bacterium]|nr:YciI family protein [Acidimicrobiales bacterium]